MKAGGKTKVWRAGLGACAIALLATGVAAAIAALSPLDVRLYDSGLLARAPKPPQDIVILGIDEEFMAGGHASIVPRDKLARLIDTVASGRPTAIVVDVWLDSRLDKTPDGVDSQLAAALMQAKTRGINVLLADLETEGPQQQTLTGTTARGSTLPYFAGASSGTGNVVMEADADGTIRRLAPMGNLPFLPELAANVHARRLMANGATGPSQARPWRHGEPLQYVGGPGSIPITPAINFVQQPMLAPLVQGKLVFVGATYPRSQDLFETPYSLRTEARRHYGVEILAQATASLLLQQGKPPFSDATARWTDAALCLVLALMAAFLARRGALPGAGFALAVCGLAIFGALVSAKGEGGNVLLNWWTARYHPAAIFCLGVPLATALSIAWRQMEQARELRQVRDAFGAYVGDEILAELGGKLPELGGEVRPIAVLFCDIRGYSALAERMQEDPRGLMNELNAHFQPLVGALKEEGAYVDNYVGDLVMALFNAPVSLGGLEQATVRAVRAANEFVRLVNERNAQRQLAGEPPIEVGIGVHCGDAVVGNLGAMDTGGRTKIHYTAIGDTVNIASRVESATRGYAVPLLVTEEVTTACGATFQWEFVAETQVKGRTAPVRLYKPQPSGGEG